MVRMESSATAMPWRDLPPALRGRTHTVSLPIGLLTVVATVAFALLWLAGPVVLAAVFLAREDYVLFALLVPLLAWWAIGTINEPMILGLLFSFPQATWGLVQQARGTVDTEDLEDGRYVGLAEWRGPTAAERELLERLVGTEPELPELREQIAQAEVRAECVCGCGSVLLYPTAPPIPREAGRDELTIGDDVRLHVHLGSVRELELQRDHGGPA